MKKLMILITFAALSFFAATSYANHRGTKEEAKAMVQKAIAFMKKNGIEKTIAEAKNKNGQFIDRDLYVVIYDMKMVNLAHINPAMVGKDLLDQLDTDRKPYMRERLEIAKKGSGWQDYKFMNPVSKEMEMKSMYLERVGDYVFGSGAYTQAN